MLVYLNWFLIANFQLEWSHKVSKHIILSQSILEETSPQRLTVKIDWNHHRLKIICSVFSFVGSLPRRGASGVAKQGKESSGCLLNLLAWVKPSFLLFFINWSSRDVCRFSSHWGRSQQHIWLNMQPFFFFSAAWGNALTPVCIPMATTWMCTLKRPSVNIKMMSMLTFKFNFLASAWCEWVTSVELRLEYFKVDVNSYCEGCTCMREHKVMLIPR